jgi:putative Mg2+ transporter-C (MgtC) family protein
MGQGLVLEGQFLVGMVLSLVAGAVIGAERDLRRKPAGISTQTLVVGAAMMLSYLSVRVAGADPARIASQIVPGVGFLGAGIILRTEKGRVSNLTTAASVWFSAAVGMAIGLGYYLPAIVATVYAVVVSRLPAINEYQFLKGRQRIDG